MIKELLAGMVNVQKNPTMTVVAVALLDGAGRILLQQRAPGRSMAGLWEFPGGKVEEGETAEAALVREIEEELGVQLESGALQPACFASDEVGGRRMILLLYVCRQWRGEPEALDAAALRWATLEEMRGLPMPPADEPLIPLLDAILSRAS